MKNGQVIPYTETCNYLDNMICSHDDNAIIDCTIADMNRRVNNVLAEFSHCESVNISFIRVYNGC